MTWNFWYHSIYKICVFYIWVWGSRGGGGCGPATPPSPTLGALLASALHKHVTWEGWVLYCITILMMETISLWSIDLLKTADTAVGCRSMIYIVHVYTYILEITLNLELVVSKWTVCQQEPVELCIRYSNGARLCPCGLTCVGRK
jgi:hypothetical protein